MCVVGRSRQSEEEVIKIFPEANGCFYILLTVLGTRGVYGLGGFYQVDSSVTFLSVISI